jgi:signal transduction histidine kinase
LQQCDRIVEAHGGRLGIQSSPISRTYWFTLPAEPVLLR